MFSDQTDLLLHVACRCSHAVDRVSDNKPNACPDAAGNASIVPTGLQGCLIVGVLDSPDVCSSSVDVWITQQPSGSLLFTAPNNDELQCESGQVSKHHACCCRPPAATVSLAMHSAISTSNCSKMKYAVSYCCFIKYIGNEIRRN